MRGRNAYIYIVALFLFYSCSKNQITPQPSVNLDNTYFISHSSMKKMEAIYALNSGTNALGTNFVCKVSKYRVSFFGNDGYFMILKYGLDKTDSSLDFSGFFRYSQNANQGLVDFNLPKAEALAFLQTGDISNLTLNGNITAGDGTTAPISLKFSKLFSDYARNNPFEIYAHHGVQTTANPPFAENSINGVLNDEDYGVNGMEMDVHLTKDKVPVFHHDKNINIRLEKKGPISGNLDQFNFKFLETYIELIDGQRIPSLDEVATKFIDSTTMTYLWMDVKGDDSVFESMLPVVQKAYAHAAAVGRTVVIYADLPSTTVLGQFQSFPAYRDSGLPTMCELSLQDAIDNGSTRFGPRYSLGLLLSEVQEAHSLGIKVISWTLNDKTLIHNYIQNGQFDGFISDYPCFVVYDFYTMK